MAKNSDTIEPLLIAIELLDRIPYGRKITAKELHSQLQGAGFNRDLRTIQRQLDMLCLHFKDIDRDDRNKPYGYSWHNHAQGIAVRTLSPQESLLLGLAEEHLKNLLPARLMKSMESFFIQARRTLGSGGSNQAKREREWQSKVRVVATSQPLLPPKIATGVFEAVSEALYGNFWLNLDYCNASGKRSEIEVMPLGLAQQGPRLYLVCRYQGYSNERSLALHRMRSAKVSPLSFERPKNFNLKKYDDDGRFGFGEGERIKLIFCIEKEAGFHLTESPLYADQQVTAINDSQLEISATVVNSAMLQWWLRGFGDAVTNIRQLPIDEQINPGESR